MHIKFIIIYCPQFEVSKDVNSQRPLESSDCTCLVLNTISLMFLICASNYRHAMLQTHCHSAREIAGTYTVNVTNYKYLHQICRDLVSFELKLVGNLLETSFRLLFAWYPDTNLTQISGIIQIQGIIYIHTKFVQLLWS